MLTVATHGSLRGEVGGCAEMTLEESRLQGWWLATSRYRSRPVPSPSLPCHHLLSRISLFFSTRCLPFIGIYHDTPHSLTCSSGQATCRKVNKRTYAAWTFIYSFITLPRLLRPYSSWTVDSSQVSQILKTQSIRHAKTIQRRFPTSFNPPNSLLLPYWTV